MAEIRWYKRDPTAALEGMATLTLEQRGAYNTILDLIYAKGGSVDDDSKFLSWWLKCDVRIWTRIRQVLLEQNKLYLCGTTLRNGRADHEIEEARRRINLAAKAGLASAAKRRAIANATNEIISTDVEPPFQPSTPKTKSTFLSNDEDKFGHLVSAQLGKQSKKDPSKPACTYTKQDLEAMFARRRGRLA
jgi:uncharacterized protein YdaU (DUF1376 family)